MDTTLEEEPLQSPSPISATQNRSEELGLDDVRSNTPEGIVGSDNGQVDVNSEDDEWGEMTSSSGNNGWDLGSLLYYQSLQENNDILYYCHIVRRFQKKADSQKPESATTPKGWKSHTVPCFHHGEAYDALVRRPRYNRSLRRWFGPEVKKPKKPKKENPEEKRDEKPQKPKNTPKFNSTTHETFCGSHLKK